MKKREAIAPFIEGAVVGGLLALVLNLICVETTTMQLTIIIASTLIITSAASAISRAVVKGENPLRYEWTYKYGDHTIVVKAGLREELYINNKLADKKTGVLKVELKGQLDTGEKVTARITGGTSVSCEVFVDDIQLHK